MTACSALSRDLGEPLAGTAPTAPAWVVIEQPGQWGAKALRDAALPDGLGEHLAAAAESTGVGILLARHPSRPARQAAGQRHAWVADVRPGHKRMHHGVLDDIADVRDWDFAAIAAGTLPPLDRPAADPLLLVCTQGGRDACCATIGRPLLATIHGHFGARSHLAWEASHIGGHRFAPTMLVLPIGAVYGRLNPGAAVSVLHACAGGRVPAAGLRGRTALSPPAQAAQIALLGHLGAESASSADTAVCVETGHVEVASVEVASGQVESDDLATCVAVRHADGRAWQVRMRRALRDGLRPESCGGDLRPVHAWQAVSIDPA